jgi:hypothetical protein
VKGFESWFCSGRGLVQANFAYLGVFVLWVECEEKKGGVIVVKKAVIEVLLVEESVCEANEEIEDEVLEELLKLSRDPWAAKIEKVTISST